MSRGLYYPPPPPFVGGRQPYAPSKLPPSLLAVQVDDPPPRGGYVALAVILSCWLAPAPFQQAQAKTAAWNVPAVVSEKPAYTPLPLAVYEAWREPWRPIVARNLPPSITAVQVDDPPPVSGLRDPDIFYSVLQTWQSLDWRIDVRKSAAWDVPAVVAAQPAYSRMPWSIYEAWQPKVYPQALRLLPPSLTAVAVDDPPPGSRDPDVFYSVLQAWRLADVVAQGSVKNAAWNIAVAPAEQPAYRRFPYDVLAAWTPALQLTQRQIQPAITAVSVDGFLNRNYWWGNY